MMKTAQKLIATAAICIGASWLLAWQAVDKTNGQSSCSGRTQVKLNVRLQKDRFLVGETVDVDITLLNDGSAAAQVPALASLDNSQPVYRLVGPDPSDVDEFSYRAMKWDGPLPIPESDQPELRTLLPGDYLENGFTLNQWRRLDRPGRYVFSVRIDGDNWTASESVEFTLESNRYVDAALGVDVATDSTRTVRCVWLGQRNGARTLGETFFYEKRPDLAEIKMTGARSIAAASSGARDPFCPWINYDRSDGLVGWHGWRDGSRLFAVPMGSDKPVQVDIGSPIELVRPAVMTAAGEMDVFVIAPERQELMLVRFLHPRIGEPAPEPKVLWKLTLPLNVQGACATLTSKALGSERRVLLTAADTEKVAVFYLNAGDGTQPGNLLTIGIDDARLIPDTNPAIYVDKSGTSAAILCRSEREPSQFAVVDLNISHDGNDRISRTNIGELPAPVRAGGIQYSVTPILPGRSVRREWAILMENGLLVCSSGRSRQLEQAPVIPLQLLPMSAATYLLKLDPVAGAQLSPLN